MNLVNLSRFFGRLISLFVFTHVFRIICHFDAVAVAVASEIAVYIERERKRDWPIS